MLAVGVRWAGHLVLVGSLVQNLKLEVLIELIVQYGGETVYSSSRAGRSSRGCRYHQNLFWDSRDMTDGDGHHCTCLLRFKATLTDRSSHAPYYNSLAVL